MIGDPRTYRIIGAAMAVHRKLGNGFLEAVYQEALAIQFHRDGIPFRREVSFDLTFEGQLLVTKYRADFVCYGEVLVELKAQVGVGLPESSQVVNYLRASGLAVGLLLNFGLPSLEHRRYIFTPKGTTKSAKLRTDVTLHVLGPQSRATGESA
ncbi:MAG: GxxExxY protein [Thermoplasmatota archaeon]